MKKSILCLFVPGLAALALFCGSCNSDRPFMKASETITTEELREYTQILGADSMMGRKPFTPGETITVNYLASELDRIGFKPAFGDLWFQEVPMVEITTRVEGKALITVAGKKMELSAPDDLAVESPSMKQLFSIAINPVYTESSVLPGAE